MNPMVFLCPSDDWQSHSFVASGFGVYPFSYAMNVLISNTWFSPPKYPILKLSMIRNAAEKIVMIEADERVISEGMFASRWVDDYSRLDEIACRHGGDKGIISRGNWNNPSIDVRKWANAFFADGHVDYINGTYAYDRKHLHPTE
jgi:prepilin-type processing-associated H-X9-DG protein